MHPRLLKFNFLYKYYFHYGLIVFNSIQCIQIRVTNYQKTAVGNNTRQNKHILLKYFHYSSKFLCTVKLLLCTILCTDANFGKHNFN